MNENGKSDLEWWRLPGWASAAPRIIIGGLVVGLLVGLGLGLASGLANGLEVGLVTGLAFILVRPSSRPRPPVRISKTRLRQPLSAKGAVTGFVVVLGFALVIGLASGHRPPRVLEVGLVVALLFGLWFGLGYGLVERPSRSDDTSSLSPNSSWRADLSYLLLVGLIFGLLAGLGFGLLGLLFGPGTGLTGGLVSGLGQGLGDLVTGCVQGLGFGLWFASRHSQSWQAALANAQLSRNWQTPIRLMRFLNDAHQRNVLRTVGPAYQFRHTRLQDRLAEQAKVAIPAKDPSKAPAL